ncbi:unnamed protein product [Closterium sp. Yama58-4]|nr:unnamed protein product [Closterium sp. Yama58-4]
MPFLSTRNSLVDCTGSALLSFGLPSTYPPSCLSCLFCTADNCAAVNCGPGGKCVYKENGDPTCSCDVGYQMPPDKLVCVDKCASVNCGPNGKCEQDAAGNPFCSCTTGFKPSSDNLTCVDTCAEVNCGPNGKCVKKDNGDPTCSCNAGYQMPPDKLICVETACYVLGCEPEGVCVNNNGARSCKWNSPCGACPSGATCRFVQGMNLTGVGYTEPPKVDVPVCECPAGYGMTPTECVKGAPDEVLGYSITLIQDPTAKDKASKPYTFRYREGCTQFPKEVAGNYTVEFHVHGIGDAPMCRSWRLYDTDNCTSTPLHKGYDDASNFWAFTYTAVSPPLQQYRSMWCNGTIIPDYWMNNAGGV